MDSMFVPTVTSMLATVRTAFGCLNSRLKLTFDFMATKNSFSSSFPNGVTRVRSLRWNLDLVSTMFVRKAFSVGSRFIIATSEVTFIMTSSVSVAPTLSRCVFRMKWKIGWTVKRFSVIMTVIVFSAISVFV